MTHRTLRFALAGLLLAPVGCTGESEVHAEASWSEAEVKAEAENADAATLEDKIEAYESLVDEKVAEIEDLAARIAEDVGAAAEDVTIGELGDSLSEVAQEWKAEKESLEQEVAALRKNLKIYKDELAQKEG